MGHYYDKEQDSKLLISNFKINLFGNELKFSTPSGVFSKGELDKGTEILLKYAIIKGEILDLGCGYGIIGISISKANKNKVFMVDINKRAVQFSKINAKQNNVDVEIIQSDGFSLLEKKFDTILLNPPQHAGKDVCIKLIKESFLNLKKDGILQIVARHKKGGKDLSEKMKQIFGNVKILGIKSGFRVYAAIK